jgi:hypothetical protein
MSKLRALAVLIVLIALLSLPCPTAPGIKGLDLGITFSSRALTDNLFTDLTFRFKTTSDFAPFTEDLTVVSRYLYRGRVLTEDIYAPPVPTSKWRPDGTYAFTRQSYIPRFINEFDPSFKGSATVDLSIGFGNPSGTSGEAVLPVLETKLRIFLATEAPVIVYLSGWYEAETESGEPSRTWRWTGREARCAIDNPGRDALLVIRGAVDPEAAPGQKITISVAGRFLDEFTPDKTFFERHYTVKKEWLGARKDFLLDISVDKTFVPARVIPGSNDTRELGVRISLIYFR